jgi:glycerophosphoryl diester phosphodiesterase
LIVTRRPRPLVIGHRGAPVRAPENTIASFQAAVEAGADAVEFDVAESLVIAHSLREHTSEPLVLDDVLEFFRGNDAFLHVDLKRPGIEEGVAAAVARHGLEHRTYVSSTSARALRRLRVLAPGLECVISYPNDRLRVSRFSWPRAVTATAATGARSAMPARVPLLLRASGTAAISLHRSLVSAAVARQAPVLAWTVNTAPEVERLAALGVAGIITDDPEMARKALATLGAP